MSQLETRLRKEQEMRVDKFEDFCNTFKNSKEFTADNTDSRCSEEQINQGRCLERSIAVRRSNNR